MRTPYVVLYVLAMVGTIVAVDVLFMRHHTLARLLINIGIVVAFGTVYVVFLRRR